jgi:hypothetical protein
VATVLHSEGTNDTAIVAAVNEAKKNFGALTDPNHHHTAGAFTGTAYRAVERMVPDAPGATVHASMAGGGALNVSTAFTQHDPPKNMRISRSGVGALTVYTVTGTRLGAAQTENITSNGASDVEGVKIFDTVTLITSDVDPTVNTTLKTGLIIGLQGVVTALDYMSVASAVGTTGVIESGTLNAAKDGVTPTSTPDGTKLFAFHYSRTPAGTSANTADAATGITVAVGATTSFHLDASELTVAVADATSGSLPSLIKLANAIKVVYQHGTGVSGGHPGHINDTIAHLVADTTNPTAAADCTDLTTAESLVDDMRTKFRAHLTQTGVHVNNDGTTTVDSTACDSLAHTVTVANSLKAALNTHMANAMSGSALRMMGP